MKSTIEDALPSSNPARQFANRAKQAVNKATSGVDLENPAKEFANRTKQAVKDAGSDLPNPAKEFANKARSASAEVRELFYCTGNICYDGNLRKTCIVILQSVLSQSPRITTQGSHILADSRAISKLASPYLHARL